MVKFIKLASILLPATLAYFEPTDASLGQVIRPNRPVSRPEPDDNKFTSKPNNNEMPKIKEFKIRGRFCKQQAQLLNQILPKDDYNDPLHFACKTVYKKKLESYILREDFESKFYTDCCDKNMEKMTDKMVKQIEKHNWTISVDRMLMKQQYRYLRLMCDKASDIRQDLGSGNKGDKEKPGNQYGGWGNNGPYNNDKGKPDKGNGAHRAKTP